MSNTEPIFSPYPSNGLPSCLAGKLVELHDFFCEKKEELAKHFKLDLPVIFKSY